MTWNFHPTHYSAENPTAEIRNEISVSKQQPAPFHISRPKNVTHFGAIKKNHQASDRCLPRPNTKISLNAIPRENSVANFLFLCVCVLLAHAAEAGEIK